MARWQLLTAVTLEVHAFDTDILMQFHSASLHQDLIDLRMRDPFCWRALTFWQIKR